MTPGLSPGNFLHAETFSMEFQACGFFYPNWQESSGKMRLGPFVACSVIRR